MSLTNHAKSQKYHWLIQNYLCVSIELPYNEITISSFSLPTNRWSSRILTHAFFNTTCAPFKPASSTLFPKSSITAGGNPLVKTYGSVPACDPICCPNSVTGLSKLTLTTRRFPFNRRMAMEVVGLEASSACGVPALDGSITLPDDAAAAGVAND
mmetsp:Transcript_21070/g.38079  ORF Transcript_21070/g.38079 Transcript_21070/m.38079 type:complete len:155 (+) Transcript_21070:720-1184(+)